jgi:hypothetical protein
MYGRKYSYVLEFINVYLFIHIHSLQVQFCGNSGGQRHPDTGEVMLIHRWGAKFPDDPRSIRAHLGARGWTHVAFQGALDPSYSTKTTMSELLPPNCVGCINPVPTAPIEPVSDRVRLFGCSSIVMITRIYKMHVCANVIHAPLNT